MKNTRSILLLLLAILSHSLLAQDITPVPMNPGVLHGKLDNGMTYYIKNNSEPEKRASFYIIQNVGSLLENSEQNGLAHFLEHMAFNGTKHFPGKGIINSLEKHGVAFGYNINAYTSHNETVYMLSDIPVESPGLLDSCLLILNDWSNYLLLTDEEIEAERGVITEEWRTSRNAGFRMMNEYMPVLLRGSKFPERDIIGDLEIIKNFDYQTLRDFYHDWYRTDLQAIAIVGDFDAVEMELKVIELFSRIPAVENPKPRPFFEVPEHSEILFAQVTDSEESQNSIDMYIKIKSVDPELKGHAYLREQYVRTLFNSMASKRVSELLQKGTPPFISGTIRYGGFVRGYDVFSIAASSKANEEQKAFKAIYTEAERIRRFGFSQGELDRAKSTMLSNWESYYNERDKISNDQYISSIQNNFLNNEPMASVDYEYEVIKKIVPEITLKEVSEKAKIWMTDENRVIIVTGPEQEDISHMSEIEAKTIINEITNGDLDPYIDEAAGDELIGTELPGSSIIKSTQLKKFDAVEWTLANGVKVIYKKADFEKDNVSLSAYSPGGASLVSDDLIPEIGILSTFAANYGVGEFDNITLQKMLTGKKASLAISVGEVTENISGTSTPKDFETMLQLLYLKFEKPRFDEEAHNALMQRYMAMLESMNNNPMKVRQDSVTLILTNYHPRTRILDNAYLEDVEFKNIEMLYRERINDADDFTFFIVGNIEESTVKPLVEKYIGSLTSSRENEKWVDHKVNQAKGTISREIPLTLTDPKSTVLINYSAEIPYNPYNRQAIRVLNGILDMIYTETIREQEGGTYGVSVSLALQQFPSAKANGTIMFDCDPARALELKSIVYREIDKLIKEGPSTDYLDKAVNNLLKNREESKTHNSYWLNTLYSWYFSGVDYNNPSNYEDILKNLTPGDISKLAGELFENGDIADIVFSPKQ